MKHAVLLLAHGTPEAPKDVPAFLQNVTGGRPLPEAVVEEVKRRYALIGRSPLTEITARQARALAGALDLPVYVGMRNWHPFIAQAVGQMAAEGVGRAVTLCMAPQNSRTSVGLYKSATLAAAGTALKIDLVEAWHDEPLLARAFAARLTGAWEKACAELFELTVSPAISTTASYE